MMEKVESRDVIEVITVSDIYKRDDDTDDLILVKKEAKVKQLIYKYDIEHVRQVVNSLGNVRTKRVELGMRSKDPLIIEGSYNDYKNLVKYIDKPIVGFKFYAK